MKKAKLRRPKTVTYEVLEQKTDVGRPLYERLYGIVDAHHEDLSHTNVRIALAWCTSWKADVDGRIILGKCKKASDLDRELAPVDFVILLNKDFWMNPRVTDAQRNALLDHELMHAALAYDEDGFPKRDARGRQVYRIRKHDLEEFSAIVARHGCYKRDIEEFAHAIARAEQKATGWVGYTQLSTMLKTVGLEVTPQVVATWSDDDRRAVQTWALLQQDEDGKRVDARFSSTMPPCLTAALNEPPSAGETATH